MITNKVKHHFFPELFRIFRKPKLYILYRYENDSLKSFRKKRIIEPFFHIKVVDCRRQPYEFFPL